MLKFRVDAGPVLRSFQNLNEYLDHELHLALDEATKEVQKTARQEHRYKVRTGRLQRSTKQRTKELVSEVYLDGRTARYGVFVHEGHGSWKPDRFIPKAFKKNNKFINNKLSEAIARSITKAGLSN